MKVSDVLKRLSAQLGREASHSDLAHVFGIQRSAVSQWVMNDDQLPIRRQYELHVKRPELIPDGMDVSSAASQGVVAVSSCSET
jgi:hypothetical protein